MASKRQKKTARTKPRKEPRRLLTRQELALAMAVAAGTITKWERDGMPVAKKFHRGKPSLFDLNAVNAWREATAPAKEEGLSLEQERAKLAVLAQAKAEMELAERRGELVDRSEVVATARSVLAALAAKIRGIPRALVQGG